LGDIDKKLLEPTKFSFWIASNMPFTEGERLKLLQMHSTFERLRIIYDRVKDLSIRESYICCCQCEAKLTNVKNVFTVGGAEGATSNYGKQIEKYPWLLLVVTKQPLTVLIPLKSREVNDHGYIHQIMTLREVDAGKLFFHGDPSTENR
jgi:hypothetical protein